MRKFGAKDDEEKEKGKVIEENRNEVSHLMIRENRKKRGEIRGSVGSEICPRLLLF